jgi:hypothetical protein
MGGAGAGPSATGTSATAGAGGTSVSSGGTPGAGTIILAGLGGAGGSGGQATDDCAESAKVVYLVTQENTLVSFDPRLAGLSAYKSIGQLTCETASTPQSMSVDRDGTAYVFYSSGHLYRVSTTSAACTPTSYQHPVSPSKSFNQLGMGFTAETAGSTGQVLYIQSPDFGLATVDLQTLAVSKRNVFPTTTAELTGGPDAVLFMFSSGTAELAQIDRSTFQAQPIHRFSLQGISAFALSRYAGVFYVFTAGSTGGRTRTTAFDPQTNTESVRDSDIGVTVVGAGQSTCVPPPVIL